MIESKRLELANTIMRILANQNKQVTGHELLDIVRNEGDNTLQLETIYWAVTFLRENYAVNCVTSMGVSAPAFDSVKISQRGLALLYENGDWPMLKQIISDKDSEANESQTPLMSARETSGFFSAMGNIESINNVPESGDWEYRYDKNNEDYSLKIKTYLTPEDTATLGSRSGYWSSTETFIHIAETHYFNETIVDDVFGYIFAWGNSSTFEALSMPQNLATEKIFKHLLRLPNRQLINAIKRVIVQSVNYDVFRGKTTGTIYKLPRDTPPVEKDVLRDRMRIQLSETQKEVRDYSRYIAGLWFLLALVVSYNYLVDNPSWIASEAFGAALSVSIISGFLFNIPGYRELLPYVPKG